jgi:hypothetical protein
MNEIELTSGVKGEGYGLLCRSLYEQGKPLPHEGIKGEQLLQLLKARLKWHADSYLYALRGEGEQKWLKMENGLSSVIKYLETPIACNGQGRYLECS